MNFDQNDYPTVLHQVRVILEVGEAESITEKAKRVMKVYKQSHMKQFEYTKYVTDFSADHTALLNNFGLQGWQLVSNNNAVMILMREIPNPKEKNDEPKLEFIRVPEQTYPVTTDNGEARSHRNY